MQRTTLTLIGLALLVSPRAARADYAVVDKGIWPDSWPKELEPLRAQARTLEGPMTAHRMYQIPFTSREQFEAAWPHLLKVKTPAAPVILLRSPYTFPSNIKAGVIVHCPPIETDKKANPGAPVPGPRDVRSTWLWTTYIELIVDGDVVDLNRIPLPEGAPIVDERFKERPKQPAARAKDTPRPAAQP
jgi:hypothetical protein